MCCFQAAELTAVLDNCTENIQGACFTTTDSVSVALLEMCDGLYDEIAAKINLCNEDETLSCGCWAEVVTLRATFQQKCMNSKQEGGYSLFYIYCIFYIVFHSFYRFILYCIEAYCIV